MQAVLKTELSQKLVIPAYRQFCRANGLNFHFWDELPPESRNHRVLEVEMPLQRQALRLFNELKPELHPYKQKAIHFTLLSGDGDFEYTTEPLEAFLQRASDNEKRLQKLEKRMAVVCDSLVIVVVAGGTILLYRILKWPSFALDWVPPVALIIGGCFAWRWCLNTRPRKREAQRQAALRDELARLRDELLTAQKAANVSPFQMINHELLEEKLGTALAEHITNRLGSDANDPETQRDVIHDINDLLLVAGPGAELERRHLGSTPLLESHLTASMQIPAQRLARSLPKRTAAWMAAEPLVGCAEREGWVETGRWLLEQVQLDSYDSLT